MHMHDVPYMTTSMVPNTQVILRQQIIVIYGRLCNLCSLKVTCNREKGLKVIFCKNSPFFLLLVFKLRF